MPNWIPNQCLLILKPLGQVSLREAVPSRNLGVSWMLTRLLSASHLGNSQLQPPVQPGTSPYSFCDFRSCRWASPGSTLPKADPSTLLLRSLASCHCSGSTPPCGFHVPRQKHGTHCDAPGSVLNISPITNHITSHTTNNQPQASIIIPTFQ